MREKGLNWEIYIREINIIIEKKKTIKNSNIINAKRKFIGGISSWIYNIGTI